jgi:hypothetical protein
VVGLRHARPVRHVQRPGRAPADRRPGPRLLPRPGGQHDPAAGRGERRHDRRVHRARPRSRGRAPGRAGLPRDSHLDPGPDRGRGLRWPAPDVQALG